MNHKETKKKICLSSSSSAHSFSSYVIKTLQCRLSSSPSCRLCMPLCGCRNQEMDERTPNRNSDCWVVGCVDASGADNWYLWTTWSSKQKTSSRNDGVTTFLCVQELAKRCSHNQNNIPKYIMKKPRKRFSTGALQPASRNHFFTRFPQNKAAYY